MSRVGPLKGDERRLLLDKDRDNQKKYKDLLDRESAYERLNDKNTASGQIKDKLRSFGSLFGFKR